MLTPENALSRMYDMADLLAHTIAQKKIYLQKQIDDLQIATSPEYGPMAMMIEMLKININELERIHRDLTK